jgi:hypothetical protein
MLASHFCSRPLQVGMGLLKQLAWRQSSAWAVSTRDQQRLFGDSSHRGQLWQSVSSLDVEGGLLADLQWACCQGQARAARTDAEMEAEESGFRGCVKRR